VTDCTYCGCEVEAHDPLAVYETDDGDGPGALAGEFCNWGCLGAYVDDSDVATDTTCNWTADA